MRWSGGTATTALVVLACLPSAARADAQGKARELRPLVVKVTATLAASGVTKNGFGFIVGERGGSLFVVTANHVVREGLERAQSVSLEFYEEQGVTRTGQLPELYETTPTDLAIITVPGTLPKTQACGDFDALRKGTQVTYVGRSNVWYVPSIDGVVNSEHPDQNSLAQVDFAGAVAVMEGTSGAPLVSSRGFAGMILQDSTLNVTTVLGLGGIKLALDNWALPWGIGPCREIAPKSSRWWLWAIGAGVALGASAIVFAVTRPSDPMCRDPYKCLEVPSVR